jgi:hypothetical protein
MVSTVQSKQLVFVTVSTVQSRHLHLRDFLSQNTPLGNTQQDTRARRKYSIVQSKLCLSQSAKCRANCLFAAVSSLLGRLRTSHATSALDFNQPPCKQHAGTTRSIQQHYTPVGVASLVISPVTLLGSQHTLAAAVADCCCRCCCPAAPPAVAATPATCKQDVHEHKQQ